MTFRFNKKSLDEKADNIFNNFDGEIEGMPKLFEIPKINNFQTIPQNNFYNSQTNSIYNIPAFTFEPILNEKQRFDIMLDTVIRWTRQEAFNRAMDKYFGSKHDKTTDTDKPDTLYENVEHKQYQNSQSFNGITGMASNISNTQNQNVIADTNKPNLKENNIEKPLLLEGYVQKSNKENIEKIANEIASVFCEKIVEIYNISNIYLLDKAKAKAKTAPAHLSALFIFIFIVFILLFTVYLYHNAPSI